MTTRLGIPIFDNNGTPDPEIFAVEITLPPEPEQTAVRFDIPTRTGGILLCSALVHHNGEKVVNVILPPHFRDYAVAAGLDRFDEDFERFLCAMAKMVFARQATHLVCNTCEQPRGSESAGTNCTNGRPHDWRIAR
jgi:hypothetical protein